MKNKLRLVIFSSALHDSNSVMGSRLELFEGLRRFAELDLVYPSMLATAASINGQIDGGTLTGRTLADSANEKTLCFIATGGTEEIFRIGSEPMPDTLTSSEPLPKFPKGVVKAFEKTRIGLIGGASDWLIASGIDREAVAKNYGATFVDIPLRDREVAFAAMPDDTPELRSVCTRLERFLTDDRTPEQLQEAARMYLALRKLCADKNINALTIKCFGLLNSCRTTACLALSLLNDEGIVSGCEGDIPALWTMLYTRYAFGAHLHQMFSRMTGEEGRPPLRGLLRHDCRG